MYIKYAEYNGNLKDGDIVLMSHLEFVNGGKELINIPVCVTPDGEEPKEVVEFENGLEQLHD